MTRRGPRQAFTCRATAAAATTTRARRFRAVALKILPVEAIDARLFLCGIWHAFRQLVVRLNDILDHSSYGMRSGRNAPRLVFNGVIDTDFPCVALCFHCVSA